MPYISDEANRCYTCRNPMCQKACPIHTNIPEMVRLFRTNRVMEAAEMLFENNPLSIVCSLVCNHENQCEGHCIQGIKGVAVNTSAIENYISDSCFERIKPKMEPYNGMKVAVIGAGPAGITIAVILAQRGYKITIFENRDKIGGIMRYGIPEYRLPKSILDRYYLKMKEMGILFRPNFTVGGYIGIQDLLDDGYKSVFIGTGAWRPKRLNIPGETFGNVQYAVNYLNNPDVYDLGDHVAVIGAGNAAMDAARTAIRKGSREVTVYVRRDKVASSKEEYEYAKLDGVKFEFMKAPLQITDDGLYVADTRYDEEGKVEIMKETSTFIPASSIIISVSQEPQDRLVTRDRALKLNERGTLKTDDNGETTMPGVFASGDVVTGAKTVVHAVETSKKIAEEMDAYMKGLSK